MTLSSGESCRVCNSSEAKYKCPTCRVPYCSVSCCQRHKDSPSCQPPPPPPTQPDTDSSEDSRLPHPIPNTLSSEQLELLKESQTIRSSLANPHLRQILSQIAASKEPTQLIAGAMLEPIFEEFATQCLRLVQQNENINQ